MSFEFGPTSLRHLDGVDPRLVNVAKLAIEISTVNFLVLMGLRGQRDQWLLYAEGRTRAQLNAVGCPADIVAQPTHRAVTWVTHSKHIEGKAIDVGVYPYDPNAPISLYTGPIKTAFFRAALPQHVKIRWGGDWNQDGITEHGENDYGHFEVDD